LLGDDTHPPDIFLAGVLLGDAGMPRPPLAGYLVGRNLVQHGFQMLGISTLVDAFVAGLPTARLRRETLRQIAIAGCAIEDRVTTGKVRARIEAADSPFVGASGGRRDATLRMIERCTGTP
jgi:hypothetical protein